MLLVAPAAAAPAGGVITVSTSSDATNGDVRTVAGLIANPGPDGITLREALQATNSDPGQYTIRFASALAGATIPVESSPLPPLVGGDVTVEGDIDGNGKPDVTLRPGPRFPPGEAQGFQISSSGNRLHAITVEGFTIGVDIRPFNNPLPNRRTFGNTVVSGLVIRGVRNGIRLTFYSLECDPCATYNQWTNTTITGNSIEARQSGIHVAVFGSIGDRVEGVAVTDNTIRLGTRATPTTGGPAIQFDQGGKATQSRISDVLIARNSIEAVNPDGGIFIAAGLQRAQANTIEGVRILENRVHLMRVGVCFNCHAIVLDAGSDRGALTGPGSPDGNVVRDVVVAGNSMSGPLAAGVRIQAGVDGGGSHNRIENVRIARNVTRSTALGKGVYLWVGQIGGPAFEGRPVTGNRITGVSIDANRITTGKNRPAPDTDYRTAGGIVLLGGASFGRGGAIRDVRITKNRIVTAQAGVRLIGGLGRTARGNSVTCVRLVGNRITGTRNAVAVKSNVGGASGNRASLGGC